MISAMIANSRFKLGCKILAGTHFLVFCTGFCCYWIIEEWVRSTAHHDHPPTCSMNKSLQFIEELCYNYTAHHNVAGSLCQPLCTNNTNVKITFLECLSHKSNKVIVLSKLNGLLIILKAVDIRESTRHKSQLTTYFSLVEAMTLSDPFKLPFSVIRRILSECDKNSDGLFTKEEATYCWHMYDSEDIRIMLSLHDNPAIPALYGTCGNMMAIEYASNEPMIQTPMTMEYRSWKLRAQMGVALIELAENLDDTKYGTLYLCDFSRSNIGFVVSNNHLIAKTIDNDWSVFKRMPNDWRTRIGHFKFHHSNKCTSDSDCNILRCISTCNLETGVCSEAILNSNLNIICSHFLLTPKLGLLANDVAVNVRQQMASLLHKCTLPLGPLPNYLPLDIL